MPYNALSNPKNPGKLPGDLIPSLKVHLHVIAFVFLVDLIGELPGTPFVNGLNLAVLLDNTLYPFDNGIPCFLFQLRVKNVL